MDFLIRLVEFFGNHLLLWGAFLAVGLVFILLEMKRGGHTVSSGEVTRLLNREQAVIVDIRDKKEYEKGHIVDSIHIPYASVSARLGELMRLKEKPVIIVDAMGQHSGVVGKQLKKTGFSKIFRLKSGITGWQSDGLPLVASG